MNGRLHKIPRYSQRTSASDGLAPNDPALTTFAWTNNAAHIRILTNGLCESSCPIVAHQLTSVHKVKLASPLQPPPYTSIIGLPILEINAHGSDVPLEYDTVVSTAAYRMAYTATNSQDSHVMWGEVASHAWST
ncbi:MAG: hypothetical protein JOS17DRAFT_820335 [Linnemannia elongata]|nr:MAG: hypothetical protein JOS17DRAFT_820335 [Linnemannia elongata]